MGVPTAVSSSTKTPGLYLKVDLLAGASSPGTASLRALIVAPKSSAGTITPDTQIKEAVGGEDEMKTFAGPGTPGHLAAVRLFRRYPLALVDYVAPAAGAGLAASGTFTLSGTPSSSGTIRVTIKGVVLLVAWNSGESPTTAAGKCVTAINGASNSLPVTASNVGGAVTLTAKIGGKWGNDIRFLVEVFDATGGSVSPDTPSALSGGTLEANTANVLSLVSTRQYDIIVLCTSNADAEDNGGSSEVSRLKTHINTYNVGLNARLQTAIVGVTSAAPSGPKAGAVKHNDGPIQYVYGMNFQELGCELAGFEAGDRIQRQQLEFGNPNRIGTIYSGFVGPFDKVADKPTDAETEDALNNGLSILSLTAQNDVVLVAPITTHSQDSSGNPDFRIFYVTEVTGAYAFAQDLKVALPQEFHQVKIVKDGPPGAEPLPPRTVEERDVKAFVIGRARFFQRAGVLRRDKLDEAIDTGTLIVQVDAVDASQVNIVVPSSIVKPLAKFSTVVQKNA